MLMTTHLSLCFTRLEKAWNLQRHRIGLSINGKAAKLMFGFVCHCVWVCVHQSTTTVKALGSYNIVVEHYISTLCYYWVFSVWWCLHLYIVQAIGSNVCTVYVFDWSYSYSLCIIETTICFTRCFYLAVAVAENVNTVSSDTPACLIQSVKTAVLELQINPHTVQVIPGHF